MKCQNGDFCSCLSDLCLVNNFFKKVKGVNQLFKDVTAASKQIKGK